MHCLSISYVDFIVWCLITDVINLFLFLFSIRFSLKVMIKSITDHLTLLIHQVNPNTVKAVESLRHLAKQHLSSCKEFTPVPLLTSRPHITRTSPPVILASNQEQIPSVQSQHSPPHPISSLIGEP